VLNDIVIVKDEQGQTFIPEFNINSIGPWRNLESYYVYADRSVSLTIDGEVIDPITPISLDEGWNYVAYLPSTTMSPSDAFASIQGDLVVVKNQAGDTYLPSVGFDGIETLYPGQGYLVFVDQPTTLTYPSVGSQSLSALRSSGFPPQGVSSSANIIVPSASFLDKRAAVVVTGEDGSIVGRGTKKNGVLGVTVWGDDPQTDAVDGARDEEELSMQVKKRNGSLQPVPVEEYRDFFDDRPVDALTFQTNAVYLADVGSVPTELVLHGSYPNPARSEATIEYELPADEHVRITMYNSLGQRVATLVDASQKAGSHTLSVDVSQFASGMYFYRMNVSGTSQTQRLVVVK